MARLLNQAGARPEPPADDLAAIKEAFRAAWRHEVLEPRRRRRRAAAGRILALAAGVAAAAGLLWWWGRAAPPGTTTPAVARLERVAGEVVVRQSAGGPWEPLAVGRALTLGSEIATAEGSGETAPTAALRLAGGVSLRLDAGTRARLAAASVVELERGAVYLDSGETPRPEAAVEVRTPLGVARDVGTQFEVRLLEGDAPALRVRVREGTVMVSRGTATHTAAAGAEVILHPDGAVARGRVAVHGDAWAWVLAAAPPFEVDGRTVGELLDWVARETGWEVRFASDELAAEASSVVLEGGTGDVTPADLPDLALPAAGLAVQLEGGVLTVARATP